MEASSEMTMARLPQSYDFPDTFSMYTPEGDEAVRLVCIDIMIAAIRSPEIRNRETLRDMAVPLLEALDDEYGEWHDTEPRGIISDFLDAICQSQGWDYKDKRSEGYF
jgi:hypothetical protein